MQKKKNMKWILMVLTGLLAFGIACMAWRVWEIDLGTFLMMDNDPLMGMYSLKSVKEFGPLGYFVNYACGAPGNAHLVDVILSDFDTAIIGWFVTLMTDRMGVAYNLTYLISFLLAGMLMYVLLDELRVKPWIAVVFSLAFSLTPYHFLREGHLVLANIGIVPVGILFGLHIIRDDFSLKKMKDGKCVPDIRKTLLYVAGAMYIGFSFGYYPPFIIILLGVALVMKMIATRSARPLLREAILLYMTTFFWILQFLPQKIYSLTHGENPVAAVRLPMETEMYGLKIIQMLLPVPYSRSVFLASATNAYNTSGAVVNENYTATLGILGSACFITACCWLIYSYVKKPVGSEEKSLDYLSLAALASLLCATVGGFGAIVSYIASPQLRCWNRDSIVIAGLVLACGAMLVDRLCRKVGNRLFSAALCAALCALIMWDQVWMKAPGWTDEREAVQTIYEDYFAGLEETSPGAVVYEIPYEEFYEAYPLYQEGHSTTIMPYLFTRSMRWSGGGAKGRDTAAQNLYVDEGIGSNFLSGILGQGFTAVYLDTWAFEDAGAQQRHFYEDVLGLTPVVSANGRMYFYDLSGRILDEYEELIRQNVETIPESEGMEQAIEETEETALPDAA